MLYCSQILKKSEMISNFAKFVVGFPQSSSRVHLLLGGLRESAEAEEKCLTHCRPPSMVPKWRWLRGLEPRRSGRRRWCARDCAEIAPVRPRGRRRLTSRPLVTVVNVACHLHVRRSHHSAMDVGDSSRPWACAPQSPCGCHHSRFKLGIFHVRFSPITRCSRSARDSIHSTA